MADEEKQLQQARALPLPERAEHALWKARAEAFDEIRARLERVFSSEDPCFFELGPAIVKGVGDANASVMDKALEAAVTMMQKGSEAVGARYSKDLLSGIFSKCLKGRPTAVRLAQEACLLLAELEQGDAVAEAAVKAFADKVPKVAQSALDIALALVSSFGARAIRPQPLLKAIPSLLDARDAKVRDGAKQLTVELCRWVGADLIRTTTMDKMRDAMKKDVEEWLAKAGPERAQASRFTRKEQARLAALPPRSPARGSDAMDVDDEAPSRAAAAAAPAAPQNDIDSYEFAEPLDVLSQLKAPFWERLESSKWSDRRDALAELARLASHPRLLPGDYSGVMAALKKVVNKDSNAACVAEALGCLAPLSKGLRNHFSGSARVFLPYVLDQLKSKNVQVLRACEPALTALHSYVFQLHEVVEAVAATLGDKNPKARMECIRWLAECARREAKSTLSKANPGLLPTLVRCLGDADSGVREAAMGCLVEWAKKMGTMAVYDKYWGGVDEARKKALEEKVMEAVGSTRAAGGAGVPAASAAAPRAAGPALGRSASVSGSASAAAPARPATAAPSAAPSPYRRSATVGARPATAKAGGGARAAPSAAEDDEAATAGPSLSKEEAEERVAASLGAPLVAALRSGKWSDRAEAMESLKGAACGPSGVPGGLGADCLVVFLGQVCPTWGEKHVQVLGKVMEAVRLLATNGPFSKKDVYSCLEGVTDKLPDAKLRPEATAALTAFSEAVGPHFVSTQLYKKAAAHKNPKVLAEALAWVSAAIPEFGLQHFTVKLLVEWARAGVGHSTPAVRDAAIRLIGSMHRFLGAALMPLVQPDLKPAVLASIQAECEKNPQQQAAPTRTVRGAAAGGRGGKAGGAAPARAPSMHSHAVPDDDMMEVDDGPGPPGPSAPLNPLDLLPREDISGHVTPAILQAMSSAKWTDRQAAMQAIEAALQGTGYRITPGVGELVPALKGRFADSNRNLAAQALSLLGSVARSMGLPIIREARPFLSDALKNLSDSKPVVRGAVVGLMDALTEAAGAPDWLLPPLLEVLSKPNCPAEGKRDGLVWLGKALGNPQLKPLAGEALGNALKLASLGLSDKTLEAREAGGQVAARVAERSSPADLQQQLKPFPQPKRQLLEPVLAKAMASAPPQQQQQGMAQPQHHSQVPALMQTAPPAIRPGTAPAAAAPVAGGGAAGLRASRVGSVRSSTSRPGTASQAGGGSAAPSAPVGMLSDDGPLLLMDSKKEERARRQRFFKPPTKFEDPRPEDVEALEADFLMVAARPLVDKLFAKDFKPHCEAAEALRAAAANPALSPALYSFLDLVLRWCALRLAEGNTQSLLKTLDLLRDLCAFLRDRSTPLSEYEAFLLLPALVDKAGHNQDRVRQLYKEALRHVCEVFPVPKALDFVTSLGLTSANKRTRVVWLEEIAAAFERGAADACARALPAVARLVEEKDAPVRNAAVACCASAYRAMGEGAVRAMGKIPEATKKTLDDKFKYVQPLPSAAQASQQQAAHGNGNTAAAMGRGATGRSPLRQSMGGPEAVRASMAGTMSHMAPQPPPMGAGGGYVHPNLAASLPAGPSSLPQQQQQAFAPSEPAQPPPQQRPLPQFPARPTIHTEFLSTALDSGVPGTPQPPPGSQAGPLSSRSPTGPTERESTERWSRGLAIVRTSLLQDAVEGMKLVIHELQAAGSGLLPEAAVGRLAADSEELVRLLGAHADVAFFESGPGASPSGSRACKYILNALMQTFQSPSLAVMVSEPTLRALLGSLLAVLVGGQLTGSADGAMLLRALNVLVLKVLENANMTYSFSALIDLLVRQPPRVARDPASVPQYLELVVKCLIKLTKALPQALPAGRVDVDALLFSVHNFMMVLGVEEIRRRGNEDDRPLRMVKTVLHELCKLMGTQIRSHFSRIPPPGPEGATDGASLPIIHRYINVNLDALRYTGVLQQVGAPSPQAAPAAARELLRRSPEPAAPGDHHRGGAGGEPDDLTLPSSAGLGGSVMGGGAADPAAPTPTPGMRSLPQSEKDRLFGVLLAVGDRARSQQGLEDLYDFLQQHGDADVMEPIRQTMSEQFQRYVARGLSKIAERRGRAAGGGAAGATRRTPSPLRQIDVNPNVEPSSRGTPTRIPGPKGASVRASGTYSPAAYRGPDGERPPVAATENLDATRSVVEELKLKFQQQQPALAPHLVHSHPLSHEGSDDMDVDEAPAAPQPVGGTEGPGQGQAMASIDDLKARMQRMEEGRVAGVSGGISALQEKLRMYDGGQAQAGGRSSRPGTAGGAADHQQLTSSLNDLQERYQKVLGGR